MPDGATIRYLIENVAGWEISHGVFNAAANTVTRILDRSSTGALLVLAGTSVVTIIASAADLVFRDAAGRALIDGLDTTGETAEFYRHGRLWARLTDVIKLDGSHITKIELADAWLTQLAAGNHGSLTWMSNIISRASDTTAGLVADSEQIVLADLSALGESNLGGGYLIVENTGVAPTAADKVLGAVFGRGKWDSNGGDNPQVGAIAFVAANAWTEANCNGDIVLLAAVGRALQERLRIRSSGGIKATGLIESTEGFCFPAVQVPSANPNVLDDYEEGTFVPTLLFGGNGVGVAYASGFQLGRYTKIGRMVFFEVRLTLTSKGSSVGGATVAGLPFMPEANPSAIGTFVATSVTATVPQYIVSSSATTIILYNFTANSIVQLTDAAFANNSSIRLSGSYMAA